MEETISDADREKYREYAINMALGYIKAQLGVSWETVEKYRADVQVGDLWLYLAKSAVKTFEARQQLK